MAESDQTEEPTDHKLQESRKKGQVCKGQDFPTALILVGSAAMLHVMVRPISGRFQNLPIGFIMVYQIWTSIFIMWAFIQRWLF